MRLVFCCDFVRGGRALFRFGRFLATPILIVPILLNGPVVAAEQDETLNGQSSLPVDEITITATGRATPLLEVPGSSSVFTAEGLNSSSVSNLKEVMSLAPALGTINSIGESFGQLILVRGIATSGADIGLESVAGVTIDGVPLSRPNLAILDFPGIERIEFLRGPQGTLFGRNTTAGVINIVTAQPIFTPHYEINGSAGSRQWWTLRAMAEGSLAGTALAGRFDALIGGNDGYTKNPNTGLVYGGRDRQQMRGQLLYAPSETFRLRIIADYLHHDGQINGPVYRIVGPTGAIVDALSGLPLRAYFKAADITQIDNDAPRFEKSEIAGLSLQSDWTTGLGEVSFVAGYRDADAARSYDVDNSPADIANDPDDGEHFRNLTLELRLQGESGPLDYLFGVFFGRERITSRDTFKTGSDFEAYAITLSNGFIPTFPGLPVGENFPIGTGVSDAFHQRTTSFAFFTHQILELTKTLSLTLGARYSNQEKSLTADLASFNPACSAALANFGPDLQGVPASLQGLLCIPNLDPRYDGHYTHESGEGEWSGIAAANYRLSDIFSTYVQYSRGYKGGGYQLDRSGMNPLRPSLAQNTFGAETADSYEIGFHGISMDGNWRISSALFHTSLNNYQFSYFTGLNRRTQNVPELTTKGFEAEGAVRPVPSLELSISASYQEAVFGKSGFPSELVQVQGTTAPLAPRWVVVAAASFDKEIEDLGVLFFASANLRWQSRTNVGASATPSANFSQDSYAVVGARIGISGQNDSWRLELWGRNIFDQRAWSLLNSTTLQPGSISGYVTEPQLLGLGGTVRL